MYKKAEVLEWKTTIELNGIICLFFLCSALERRWTVCVSLWAPSEPVFWGLNIQPRHHRSTGWGDSGSATLRSLHEVTADSTSVCYKSPLSLGRGCSTVGLTAKKGSLHNLDFWSFVHRDLTGVARPNSSHQPVRENLVTTLWLMYTVKCSKQDSALKSVSQLCVS